jgi:hypothetical protein
VREGDEGALIDEHAKRTESVALLHDLLESSSFGAHGSRYTHLPKQTQHALDALLAQLDPKASDKLGVADAADSSHAAITVGTAQGKMNQQSYDSSMAQYGEIPLEILRTRTAVPTTLKGDEIYAKLHGNNPKLFCTLGRSEADPDKMYQVIGRPLLYANQVQ